MHMENEAPVNEPRHGEAQQAWQYCVITDALKSLLLSTWGRETLFKRQYTAISTGDPDPKRHSKDVSFSAFSGGAQRF